MSTYNKLLILLFISPFIGVFAKQSEDENQTRSCSGPAAGFCAVNAGCISANNLLVTGPSQFSGPVIISNTGQATGCIDGDPALP